MRDYSHPERDASVIAAYVGGEGCAAIAASHGVHRATVHTIIARANAEGLIPQGYRCAIKWTPEMDAELRAMSEAGIGQIPASERIGVHPEALRRRRRQLGLPHGLRGWHGICANRKWWREIWAASFERTGA